MSRGLTTDDYMNMYGGGKTQKAAKRCPECNAEVGEDDRFCRSCGEPLSDVKSGVILDLEHAKQDKDERTLLLVAAAFAAGGIMGARSASTYWVALLNTLLYGAGALLVGGVIWIVLHLLRTYIVEGREKKYGIKVIFCIVVAVAAATIAFFLRSGK